MGKDKTTKNSSFDNKLLSAVAEWDGNTRKKNRQKNWNGYDLQRP